ncbi:hypothetical protein EWM64_g5297 [Hericium alpestre]|uniref:Uncharacterized protein n=1 Tax=Hericium alpestre TaxID=135208 RepID=A0A4Y9ZXC5_9AGAM|nr:hypothetical protein EWM64_g5297 [Hericium alpestre]
MATANHDALAELKALSNIIRENIDRLEATCKANGLEYPSSKAPYGPESEAARNLPDAMEAGSLIVSAATQLVAAVNPPPMTMFSLVGSFHIPAALRVVLETHTAEILHDAGPEGKHVNEIARPTKKDPAKLARILRFLATHHVFVEVSPDHFAHNRLSSLLDTHKSVDYILANPDKKHEGTPGMTAVIGHFTDEAFKAASYLGDVLLDPKTAFNVDASSTGFNRAYNTDKNVFDWFETPGNEWRLTRFGIAMDGAKSMSPPGAILEGFDWKGMKEGSLVVDVGGGVGSQSLTLAQNHPHLQFIVEDRTEFWNSNLPEHVQSGKVQFQAYNFLEDAQPIKNADIFLLRAILHDWADPYCLTILRHLRAAAAPTTRLIVVDNLIPYACEEKSTEDIPGAERRLPPAPLLANRGQANAIPYITDIQMMALLNGQERTITHVRNLLEQTGWKLVQVYHGSPFAMTNQKAIAVPV